MIKEGVSMDSAVVLESMLETEYTAEVRNDAFTRRTGQREGIK